MVTEKKWKTLLTHYWKVKTKVDLCSIIIVEKIQEALLLFLRD
jgi:hypothetical protein